MASQNFQAALERVLQSEGGYVWHPKDPGGETNYGVTRRTARAHGYTGSMRSIPMSKVREIYRTGFWDVVKGDALPAGLDYAVFDFTVNSGPGRSVPFLCRTLGISERTRMDSLTLAEANKQNTATTIRGLCSRRLTWLKRLKNWRTFGRGWSRRVVAVEKDALAMVTATRLLP